MYLVAGTYERFLLGYNVDPAAATPQQRCSRAFTHAAHQGPVKSLAAAGNFAVSGGQDDQLHIYDLKNNKDLGFLMNPGEGAVHCVQLYTPPGNSQPSHMFSGSADGSIAIWMAGGGWEHLKLLKGHKGPVNSLAIHPTGRLALSVAHDKALRMWNLVKGRCTYTAPLEEEAQLVGFSPTGQEYCLVTQGRISTHDVTGGLVTQITPDKRALCMLQQSDSHLLCGHEDGSIRLWDLRSGQQAAAVAAHKVRVRGLVSLSTDSEGVVPVHLASGSSDGVVKLWDCRMLAGSGSCPELAVVNTAARITCLVAADTQRASKAQAQQKKKGRKGQGGQVQQPQQQQQQQQQQHGQPSKGKRKHAAAAAVEGAEPTAAPGGDAAAEQQPVAQQKLKQHLSPQPQPQSHQGVQQQQQQQQKQQKQKQQRHQQQRHQQQRLPPGAEEEEVPVVAHKKKKLKTHQPSAVAEQQQAGKASGSELLVPQVKNTLLMKKRKQQIMEGKRKKLGKAKAGSRA